MTLLQLLREVAVIVGPSATAGVCSEAADTIDRHEATIARLTAQLAEAQAREQRICALVDEADITEAIDQIEFAHRGWMEACEAIKAAESWPPNHYPSMRDRWVYAALWRQLQEARERQER